jgi:hypothetical protein
MSVTVAIDGLTLDEIELVENLAGRPIETVMNEDAPKGRTLKALVFVIQKRTNPEVKFEDVGRMSLTETMEVVNGLADPKA